MDLGLKWVPKQHGVPFIVPSLVFTAEEILSQKLAKSKMVMLLI